MAIMCVEYGICFYVLLSIASGMCCYSLYPPRKGIVITHCFHNYECFMTLLFT